jgi:hypothetical protein
MNGVAIRFALLDTGTVDALAHHVRAASEWTGYAATTQGQLSLIADALDQEMRRRTSRCRPRVGWKPVVVEGGTPS